MRIILAPIAFICVVHPVAAESPGSQSGLTNRLANSSSPYLLQHKHNPVDWYPWSDEAFQKAKKEDKPIFLSIGYAACHWCHVMAHESFESEAIAKILNEHFIAVKVDREERPDIDEIYMAATVASTGRGGWPMSVFMTPDRKPFLCGTYFPPRDRGGRRGFGSLCTDIATKWKSDRTQLLNDANSMVRQVQSRKRHSSGKEIPSRDTISRTVNRVAMGFDTTLGGRRSRGNKFPPTMAMELMLREFVSQKKESKPQLVEHVETTLTQMARGGIYDQIGGGICRYSTDPRWFAPHFEKMLYDQATVTGVYLSAYQLTGNKLYAKIARGILDYCIADLQDAGGAFYSSRDADSEGEEGKFYAWTRAELDTLLPGDDGALFCGYYNVAERGNWHKGVNILHITESDESFARKNGFSTGAWQNRLDRMKKTVFDARAQRIHPGLDDKVLAEWNGLLIVQLARASTILNEPRYRDAAVMAADFIAREMVRDGRLFRAHRQGKTHIPGYSADYANMIAAYLSLYETTFDHRWLADAEQLNEVFIKHFRAPNGGFYYTADDAEKLLVRSKNPRDGVVPSGSSVAALNLMKLAIFLGRNDLRDLAEETMRSFSNMVASSRLERMQWAVLFYHEHPKEIAIIGDPKDPATQALVAEAYRSYLPNKVVAVATPAQAAAEDATPLLKRKTLRQGKPAAYVCRNYVCGRPVTSPADLAKQLAKP